MMSANPAAFNIVQFPVLQMLVVRKKERNHSRQNSESLNGR